MKGIKMMGLNERVSDLLQEERISETNRMKSYTWMMVWMNVVGEFCSLYASLLS
jgi:hypothetical protein